MRNKINPPRRRNWIIQAQRSRQGKAWLARYSERRENARRGMVRPLPPRRAQGMRTAQFVRRWRGQ